MPRRSDRLEVALGAPPALRRVEPRVAPAFVWSRKLLTVAGIDVYVHGTFLLLIAFLAFSDLVAGKGVAVIVRGTLLILAVFTTVVLHEFGHALTARRFGIRTKDITLLPIGGIARLERMPDKPREQLLVAAAGPAVNVLIALVLFGVLRVIPGPIASVGVGHATGAFITQLMWINVSLAAFNLLPGYPMDGGRILRAVLATRVAPERATQTAARVGQGFAVIVGVVGVFTNPFLVVKVALAGVSVRDGMITEFKTLSPADALSRAVEPLTRMQEGECRVLMVVEDEKLVGLLTAGNIGELIALEAAERRPGAASGAAHPTPLLVQEAS